QDPTVPLVGPRLVAWLFLPDTSLSALPLRPLYVPADPRSCYAMIPHWFYNWQAKKCENFMYGGCDGHENNFEMQTDCLGKCGGHGEAGGWAAPRHSDLAPSSTMKSGAIFLSRDASDFQTSVSTCNPLCPSSSAGALPARQGQEGIVPPLERPCPRVLNICSLPPEVGPCTAAIPRWTYNWRAKTCEEFSYGGCRGNKNNFETEVDCLQACAGHGKTHDNLGQCCYLHRAMVGTHQGPPAAL
uniref:BPTI/Kunitz inhibitor domain-containing protein n=1 Tax=Chelydra serpentina TaxID=8475 RepID=A0A8C3SSP9_CHESE